MSRHATPCIVQSLSVEHMPHRVENMVTYWYMFQILV